MRLSSYRPPYDVDFSAKERVILLSGHPNGDTQLVNLAVVSFAHNPLSPAPANILAGVCNAISPHPIELESYPNHSRIQQVFCLKSKKTVIVLGLGFAGGTAATGGVFAFFATFTWPWTPIHWAIILTQDFFGN